MGLHSYRALMHYRFRLSFALQLKALLLGLTEEELPVG
jgi:hypothetical protein